MKKLIFVFCLILFSSGVVAMSILDVGKAYLFSEVSGVITHNGQAVSGAKVIRKYEMDKLVEEEAVTDSAGKFSFPPVRGRSISQVFPAEFVAAQKILVMHDGEEVDIWSNSKRSPEKNSELGGTPLDFTCELTDERALYRDFGAILFTRCKWKVLENE